MKSRTKIYQVAKKLRDHLNSLDQSQSLLQSIQGIISVSQSKEQKTENMFKNNYELRTRQLGVEEDRKYEFMGAGVVLRYDQIKNKKRKDAKTNTQQQNTNLTYASSRESLTPLVGSIYLTKDEVLKHYTPHSESLGTKSLRKISQTYYGGKTYHLTETQGLNQRPNLSLYNKGSANFSVAKLKQRMQKYQEGWFRSINRKKQPTMGELKRHNRAKLNQNQKYGRLLKKKYIKTEKQTANSSWVSNLRQQSQRQNRTINEIQRIETNGLNVSGRNKLKMQTLWIQDKHSKGYFFSKHQKSIGNDPDNVLKADW